MKFFYANTQLRTPAQLILIVLLLISIVGPTIILGSLIPEKPLFTRADRQLIAQQRPDYILIGNSVVYTRLDKALLEQKLGKGTYFLTVGGSSSAIWYLQFKNDVIASGHIPKWVLIFFVKNDLTRVELPLTLSDAIIEEKGALEDHLLQEMIVRQRSTKDSIIHLLYRLAPFQFFNNPVKTGAAWITDSLALLVADPDYLDYMVRKIFKKGSASAPTAKEDAYFIEQRIQLKKNQSQLFSFANQRIIPQNNQHQTAPLRPYHFSAELPDSLLPEIMKLATEHGVRLAFIRVEERIQMRPGYQRPAFDQEYMTQLERYLTGHGALLHDLTEDRAVTPDQFLDELHVLGTYSPQYTEFFAKRMETLLP